MLIVNPSTFTTWATALDQVAEHMTQCPVPTMQDALKRTARVFFTRSGIWRSDEQLLITTVADTQAYDFTPPTNAELSRVFSAWFGEVELDVAQPGQWADTATATVETDTESLVVGVRDGKIYLSPMPGTVGALIRGVVVYTLSGDSVGIPSHAWDEWGPAIAAGAASRLKMQESRPWSSPQMAGLLQNEFVRAINSASNEAGPVRRKPLRVRVW